MKKADREHLNKVAALGCVACFVQAGVWETPGEIHHIRAGQGAAQRAPHKLTLCLCPDHHRYGEHGKLAIHRSKQAFEEAYGTELELLSLTNGYI
jgi:hypothetical protein